MSLRMSTKKFLLDRGERFGGTERPRLKMGLC
jgi:hypothetical protein